jgi:hypothetical protein
VFAVPDAWHAVGPAAVLVLAGPVHGAALAAVYVAAFCAGCLVDLVSSSLREALAANIAVTLQFRVIAFAWLVDACIAPLVLLVADASRAAPARLLLLLPVMMLLLIADRDRSARIAEAQHRLGVAHTDPLTHLGNRRKLAEDLGERLVKASLDAPIVLMLFDLGGFKAYNDTFGHIAGGALLARLAHKLDTAVARLAVRLGRRLGMAGENVDELARAAALHDIGKVGIPDAILGKPGPLDAGEWEYIRQHTLLGERILSAAPALRPVAVIVRATHERWDGTGYPDGLRGDAIPLAARIIAVCDAYDAIISERCYRPARTPELARAELEREAGGQFDPTVVAAFIEELASPDGDDDSGEAVDGRSADAGGHAQLAAEVVGHVREFLERAGTRAA